MLNAQRNMAPKAKPIANGYLPLRESWFLGGQHPSRNEQLVYLTEGATFWNMFAVLEQQVDDRAFEVLDVDQRVPGSSERRDWGSRDLVRTDERDSLAKIRSMTSVLTHALFVQKEKNLS